MVDIKYPKVLVSTIPAWSQSSGANTFSTLFQGYPKDKLANIYTRADLPDSDVCDTYFRITEAAVIKSCIKDIKTGSIVEKDSTKTNDEESAKEKKRYSFFTKHRWALFLWLRELGWKFGKWNSKELDEFLENFNLDVFVFHIESYWCFNRLNRYIISKTKPKKVIGYLWDDNFTYKHRPFSIIARINRYFTRRQVKRLVNLCDTVLAISPKMKKECDITFGINSELLTKPLLIDSEPPALKEVGKPIRVIYSGSLVIGRDKAVAMLVECLKEINRDGIKIYLDIYSKTALTNSQKQKLDIPGISNFKGQLRQQDVFREQENSDILLFVENPDNKFHNDARLSFSTKITDYLSRRRAILAIGPRDIAPMEYLQSEDAALTCNSKEDIMLVLNRLVDDPNIIKEYAQKAYSCGIRNHSSDKIYNKFMGIILS